MLHQPAKDTKLHRALWTVIQLPFMRWALQVLIQGWQPLEFAGAEVTFESVPVPGSRSGPYVCTVIGIRIGKQSLGDEIISVVTADGLVDYLTICPRGASAGFEVNGHGGNGRESSGTTNTFDRSACMQFRAQMLCHNV
jgi:hypothetical protein